MTVRPVSPGAVAGAVMAAPGVLVAGVPGGAPLSGPGGGLGASGVAGVSRDPVRARRRGARALPRAAPSLFDTFRLRSARARALPALLGTLLRRSALFVPARPCFGHARFSPSTLGSLRLGSVFFVFPWSSHNSTRVSSSISVTLRQHSLLSGNARGSPYSFVPASAAPTCPGAARSAQARAAPDRKSVV